MSLVPLVLGSIVLLVSGLCLYGLLRVPPAPGAGTAVLLDGRWLLGLLLVAGFLLGVFITAAFLPLGG